MIVVARHGAQRLLASPLPDHGRAVDRRDAQPAFQPHRPFEVMPASPIDHVAAADPEEAITAARRHPDGQGEARWPRRGEAADHFCMHWRGVKDNHSKMTNSVMRGSFLQDAALRREFSWRSSH